VEFPQFQEKERVKKFKKIARHDQIKPDVLERIP
jgi:hypothetical protein